MNNSDLAKLLRNLQKPAIRDTNGNVVAGHIGQTHDELGGPDTPESSRGFIVNDGSFMQREAARGYLNNIAGHEAIKDGELSSELLRRHVPFYQSPRQKIYNFGNGRGVSVVHGDDDSNGARIANVVFKHPNNPGASFYIDYSDDKHYPDERRLPHEVDTWLDDMDKESRRQNTQFKS